MADFSGAEMGDQNALILCEYIAKSTKLKILKLIRNKLSDECLETLVKAAASSKLVSLNLAQNNFTDKALETFARFTKSQEGGSLPKNISLNFNKISKKNSKIHIEELTKRNISVSI